LLYSGCFIAGHVPHTFVETLRKLLSTIIQINQRGKIFFYLTAPLLFRLTRETPGRKTPVRVSTSLSASVASAAVMRKGTRGTRSKALTEMLDLCKVPH
jgi:hypothetical protein